MITIDMVQLVHILEIIIIMFQLGYESQFPADIFFFGVCREQSTNTHNTQRWIKLKIDFVECIISRIKTRFTTEKKKNIASG